jgi:hypothetical protein
LEKVFRTVGEIAERVSSRKPDPDPLPKVRGWMALKDVFNDSFGFGRPVATKDGLVTHDEEPGLVDCEGGVKGEK